MSNCITENDLKKENEFIPVSKWNKFYDYPTVPALRHLIFHENTNGFKKVTRRIANRIYIKVSAFYEWVEEQNKTAL